MSKYSISKIPTDVLEETALKLKQLRKQKKWSQAELAKRSGVSLGSLKRFETTGQISFSSLLYLAHTLSRLSEFENIFEEDKVQGLKELFNDK